MKLRHTIGGRVAGFVRDWSLAAAIRGRRPDPGGGAKHDVSVTAPSPRRGRHNRHQHLSLLRGRLRSAGLCQGRHVIHVEGDPRSPINRRPVSEGGGDLVLADEPRPADGGAISRAARREAGRTPARLGDGPDRLSGQTYARRNLCT
jgi:hypothetical protein